MKLNQFTALCLVTLPMTLAAQIPMESVTQFSLSCSPRTALKTTTSTMTNGSLIAQMGLSGGSLVCVGDARDRIAEWKFKHIRVSTLKGAPATETDLSGKIQMEVLGYSEVGTPGAPSTTPPRVSRTLGIVKSTRTVKVRFSPRQDLISEFWGSLVVNYSVIQEAGKTEAIWLPSAASMKLAGTWTGEEGSAAGAASLTVTLGQFKRTAGGGVSIAPGGLVLVNGGRLPADSDLGGVDVRSFRIGQTEVTFGEWKAVRDWASGNGYFDLAAVGAGRGDGYPVTNVNWFDALKWCNARSQKEGKTPVYTVDGAVYQTGEWIPEVNASANGYRLPTEAEWEFAARGGTQARGFAYSGGPVLSTFGWYYENSGSTSKPVGSKMPNELGIYDMSGNVWEWCFSPAPWDSSPSSEDRASRGGHWGIASEYCTISYRDGTPAVDNSSTAGGFRIALNAVP